MAHIESDNALVGGDAYAEEPKPQLTRRYTSGVPEYTKKPIFVKKERVPLSFANRQRRTVVSQDQEQAPNEQRNMSSESRGSSSSNAPEREQQAPGPSVRPAPATGNWLSGRRMGLEEAYSRADDNGEFRPEFRPRAALVVRSASISSAEAVAATESRIPRSTAYSPGSSLVKSSPPRSLKEAYVRAEREEQAAMDARLAIERAEIERADRGLAEREARTERERIEGEERVAQALGSIDYESESSGPRATSPSPAARPAMRPAYLEQRPNSSRSSSDGSVGSKYPPPDPVKEAEWERNRIRAEKRSERMKRILANPRPIYLSDRRGGHNSRIAEAKAILERRASSTEGEEIPEPRSSWGLKSRKTEAWMRRILNPNDPLLATLDPLTTSKGDAAQKTAADIPRSSIEVGPSAQPTPPSSRPSSAQPKNVSPEKSKMWDADIDFTAHSLQESTSPLLRVKTSRLDEVREREMQSLTARAVATNRLEEIRERNSEERSVFSESSRLNARETTPAPRRDPEEEVYHERTILEEEGEHITNTPITIFAKGHYRPSSSSSAEPNKDPEKMREESFEAIRLLARRMSPGSQRAERLEEEFKETKDSRDDEKKETGTKVPAKAKTASITKESEEIEVEETKRDSRPTIVEEKPTKSSERLEGKEDEKPLEETKNQLKRGGLDLEGEMKHRSTTSTPPKSDVDPEERIAAEAKLFELPDNKSERNSIRAPSRSPSPSDDGKCDETPRPKADPLTLPTPRVTGAYIETPAPSTRKPRKSRSISPTYEMVNQVNDVPTSSNNNTQHSSRRNSAALAEERAQQKSCSTSSQLEITKRQSQPRTSRPALINTATPASVADDLRKIARDEQYEDSTLDEFDAILESDATVTQLMNNTIIQDPIFDLEYDGRGHPLSMEERERRIERLRLDRMNQQLKNTSFSIRDARHGIERLEHQVASATANPTPTLNEQLYVHIKLKIPVPRLVVSTPLTQNRGRFAGLWDRNWRFTWLGLTLFIFVLWYTAESAMCNVYCHPKESSRNTWQPSDPFFPYAIPTKINQWTGNIGSNVFASFGQWLDPGWGGHNGYMGASDWWLGRNGPVGIVTNQDESIFNDEYI